MNGKYFVFFGHVTSDNYDQPDHHELLTYETKEEVLRLHAEWLDPDNYGSHGDCSNCVFRVIEGSELSLKPVEKIVTYELK